MGSIIAFPSFPIVRNGSALKQCKEFNQDGEDSHPTDDDVAGNAEILRREDSQVEHHDRNLAETENGKVEQFVDEEHLAEVSSNMDNGMKGNNFERHSNVMR